MTMVVHYNEYCTGTMRNRLSIRQMFISLPLKYICKDVKEISTRTIDELKTFIPNFLNSFDESLFELTTLVTRKTTSRENGKLGGKLGKPQAERMVS